MPRRKYEYVHRTPVTSYRLGSDTLDRLDVFVDARSGRPLLLPLLYSAFLSRNGYVYSHDDSRPSYLSERTIDNYLSCLHLFLETLDGYATNSKESVTCSSAQLHLVDQEYVSTYLNEYLPPKFGSFRTLELHHAAIQAFFDWLTHFGFTSPVSASLRRNAATKLGDSTTDKSTVIQYIPRDFRRELLLSCRNHRDRLIIRAGYELGLRTSENVAFVLKDQNIAGRRKPGLLSLFNTLESSNRSDYYEYWLSGKYCKGSKSRAIAIPADFLFAMKSYLEGERAERLAQLRKKSDHLFVNYGRQSRIAISPQFPTDLFKRLRQEIPHLDQGLTYHDLRHTFGTELYSRLVSDMHGHSETRALTIVQDSLGHASPASTRIYVHLFEQMQMYEA